MYGVMIRMAHATLFAHGVPGMQFIFCPFSFPSLLREITLDRMASLVPILHDMPPSQDDLIYLSRSHEA